MIQLVRILENLPQGFEVLRGEADAEGHRHMSRLANEWAAGQPRFEALFAALLAGDLVGVGGMTVEPEPSAEPAFRMRRLYVSRAARRTGVARTLVSALVQEGLDRVSLLTVHAGNPDAAAFWEAQGFTAQSGQPWSHDFRPYSAA